MESYYLNARFAKVVGIALLTGLFISCSISIVQAAISWSGGVNPNNPPTWTSTTYVYLGEYSSGVVTVDGGSDVLSNDGILGYATGRNGTITITGAGSTWTCSRGIYLGLDGDGVLNIEAGGQVSNAKDCYFGYNAGATGTATISGNGSKWIASGFYFYVGYAGSGTLNIDNGGQFETTYVSLGRQSGSSGTATVSGAGSKWTNQVLTVGDGGEGKLKITAGGQVNTGQGWIGFGPNARGAVTVSGAGSTWAISDMLEIEGGGRGTLHIEAGGQVSDSDGYVEFGANSDCAVTVTGAGSKWTNSHYLCVGFTTGSALRVEAGGQASAADSYLGYHEGSDGTVTVTGADSRLSSSGTCNVGYSGTGTLDVNTGARVTSNAAYLGYNSAAIGSATISGAGSQWTSSGDLYVGKAGSGMLTIGDGGQVGNAAGYLGYDAGSSGAVVVVGSGSTWTNSGDLYVGKAGTGTITVQDGGTVAANTLYASMNDLFGNGTITVNGALIDGNAVFNGGNGAQPTALFSTAGKLVLNPGESTVLGAGYRGIGNLTISGGATTASSVGYVGYYSGTTGTATVAGAGSKWTTSHELYIGWSGNGTLVVEAGAQVSCDNGYVGSGVGSIGVATVRDAGSQLSSTGTLFYVGGSGDGTLNIESGGAVNTRQSYVGSIESRTATVNVTGEGSTWNNSGDLFVGNGHRGTISIRGGGQVTTSVGHVGEYAGSIGTVTVAETGSLWASPTLFLGNSGSGSLSVLAGGQANSDTCYVGYAAGSNGTATVRGAGALWTNSGNLFLAPAGTATLTVADGGTVSVGTLFGALGNLAGDSTVAAKGAVLDNDVVFDRVSGPAPAIPFGSGGTLNLTPAATNALGAGYKSVGTLRVADAITATSLRGYLGYNSGSRGTATIAGTGSQWSIDNTLYVGNSGAGVLNITAGGQVVDAYAYLSYATGSSGTATVSGAGSQWITRYQLYVGYTNNGTLNIGSATESGGLVKTPALTLSSGTCNLNNGGTLQVGSISRFSGTAYFNWNDGTIRNYGATSNLSVSNSLSLRLAATGVHTFDIDAGCTGTVGAVLRDMTSSGTLTKVGDGLLNLTASNTYTGSTTIAAGTLTLSGVGWLASSVIDVRKGATFDVSAKSGGYSIGTGKTLAGAGTILGNLTVNGIHAPGSSPGVEMVKGNYKMLGQLQIELMGTAAGTGYDQVLLPVNGTTKYNVTLGGTLALDWTGMNGSSDATGLWILENDTGGTLSGEFSNYANGAKVGSYDGRDWYLWYGADAASGNLNGGNDVVIAAVPEPSTLLLLSGCLAALVGFAWRRSRKVS